MNALRSICTEIRCEGVKTYIQSGNVVFRSNLSSEALERRLEEAIEQEFDFSVPVIVRSASNWKRYVKSNPFLAEGKNEANWVLLCLSKKALGATAAADLQQTATQGERVIKKGDAIWIHYAKGIARSKLSPAVLDRHMRSAVTTRNWRTVQKLDEMARENEAA